MSPARTLVLIPAFNEEKNIGRIVSAIRSTFPEMDVLAIDDGSTDSTTATAKNSGAKVLSHAWNMGYGVALQTGYKYAERHTEYEHIAQLDGDGQHNPLDLPKLLEPLLNGEADLVIGSRFLADDNLYRIPIIKRLGMYFFRTLLYLLSGKRIQDINSGLQAFRRKILENYVSDEFPYYYPDANVLLLLIKKGISVVEVPSGMSENREGKSMHGGLGRQVSYVISMCLSILIAVLRLKGRKNA